MFLGMYTASGQGQTTPGGQNFYININLLSLGSSFEQTMSGPRPQCYIPSHKVTGPLVLEKKIFEELLLYMDMAAILVM